MLIVDGQPIDHSKFVQKSLQEYDGENAHSVATTIKGFQTLAQP